MTGEVVFDRKELGEWLNEASVKGTIVDASTGTDNAADIADTDSTDPIGVIYNSGVADGSEVWVVVAGIAQVLLEDTTASTRGNWVRTSSTTAGRADATTGSPPGADVKHWQEVGHCTETQGAGTDVLAKMVLHFN